MTDKTSKDEEATLPKLGPGKPPQISRADVGKSPQEKRGSVNSYVSDSGMGPGDWYPDPMAGPGGDAEAGAREIERGNKAANAPYGDGAGRYAPPIRNK